MKKLILISLLASFLASVFAQDKLIATIEVSGSGHPMINTPVSADISNLGLPLNDISLVLYEIIDDKKVKTDCQVEQGNIPRLWWILSGNTGAKEKRLYHLYPGEKNESTPVAAKLSDYDLKLKTGEKNILSYRYAIHYPPEGVPAKYKRSAFIHPLLSPNGNVMTRINPPDHYHHYGIWNPWTRVEFRDERIDFWNLYLSQGTVEFDGFLSKSSGSIFGAFKARQSHIAFNIRGENKEVINEILDTRAIVTELVNGKKAYLVDYTSLLSCATMDEVILEAYRYGGGIGFRANEEWTNKNSKVLTSEGLDRKQADASHARWVDVNGGFKNGTRSGILFMSHPSNRKHPESMRVWPVDANNGRGDMYFQFCPIRHEEWVLKPGKQYSQKYRLIIYDGEIDADIAEHLWQAFAFPPQIKLIKE